MSMGRAALAMALLAAGCAQVREITGGDKDGEGPRLVMALPPPGATRFTGDRIVLRFDERIQIERPRAGLLVSPPMTPPPTLHQRGARELELRLHAPLLPATTYTFALGEAVKDLTEGNRAAGLDFSFSTGDALDSLAIAGTLIDAYTQAPQDQALVLLLEEGDTAAFTGGRPAFITRTDLEGRFALRRLPARAFRLAALRDLNGNYRYDLPGEEIAFASDPITPQAPGDSAVRPISLRFFQEESAVQLLREATVTDDRAWRIVLARPAQEIAVRDIARSGGRLTWQQEWSAARDTVLLWPSDTTALADGRYVLATEEGELDTLRYRPQRPMPFNLSASASSAHEASGIRIRITATRPITSIDAQLLRLRADSVDLPVEVTLDSLSARVLHVRASLPEGRGASLTVLPRALRDAYGGTNDTLRFAVGVAEAGALGTLRVTLSAEGLQGAPLILELLDAQGRRVREQVLGEAERVVAWGRLQPGNHTLRLMEDRNGNGRWDTGAWRAQRQPERVWLHAPPINVRAGWDLGVEWRIGPE
jgi:hypothetical protein